MKNSKFPMMHDIKYDEHSPQYVMFTFNNEWMYWMEVGGEYDGKCFRKHVEEMFK